MTAPRRAEEAAREFLDGLRYHEPMQSERERHDRALAALLRERERAVREECRIAVCWACADGLPLDHQYPKYHDPGRDKDGNMRGLIACPAAAIREGGPRE